ncbi:MAG: TetR/AcrR family transcriptional regulator [Gemmatimonadota bacterium]
MARARFDNLEPERQETLLGAAADEFAAHGYAGASLNRIVEAAGISKGALYYYFDDKEDLFVSVVEETLERLVGEVGGFDFDRLEADTFWEWLRRYGQSSLELMRKDVWYVRLALAFPRLRQEPAAASGVRPALEWGRRLTTALLERGRALGVVRRDLPLGLLVEVTMAVDEAGDRWMIERLDEYRGEALQQLVEGRIDLMRDMLDAQNEGWE